MRDVHLVGSIPLADSADVFRTVSTHLNGHLRRLPDGETGKRTGWMRWLDHVFANDPQFTPADSKSQTHASGYTFQNYRLKTPTAGRLRLGEIGYAAHAKESYRVFARLKEEGVVSAAARFQVCMATPIGILWSYIVPEQQPEVGAALNRQLGDEIQEILEIVPPGDLTIQWDMPHDMLALEGARTNYGIDIDKTALVARWADLAALVPGEVELGFHLCYGDSGRKHAVEPRDTAVMVDFANALTAGISRDISYFHLPVPRDRTDVAFYRPLQDLRLRPATQLYLGLIHDSDGIDGCRQRIAAASSVIQRFGIATECGFGRRPPESVNTLLRLHAELAQ